MKFSEKARKFRNEMNIEPSKENFEEFMYKRKTEDAHLEYSGKTGMGRTIDTTEER